MKSKIEYPKSISLMFPLYKDRKTVKIMITKSMKVLKKTKKKFEIIIIDDGCPENSGKIAKDIFEKMWSSGKEVDEIIQSEGLKQVTDDKEIESMIDEVIQGNPEQLEQYRSGKDRLFGFFVGQVMKASQGKANPKQVNDILKSKLEK